MESLFARKNIYTTSTIAAIGAVLLFGIWKLVTMLIEEDSEIRPPTAPDVNKQWTIQEVIAMGKKIKLYFESSSQQLLITYKKERRITFTFQKMDKYFQVLVEMLEGVFQKQQQAILQFCKVNDLDREGLFQKIEEFEEGYLGQKDD